jgi:serine O-acetyltransferase
MDTMAIYTPPHPTHKLEFQKIEFIKNIFLIISSIRLIPHWIIYNIHKNKKTIHYDVNRWLILMKKNKNYNMQFGFLYLLTFVQEYRNLFYYRIGYISIFLKFLCRPMNTLFLNAKEIGPGLFIQHGFSTIISAKKIGKDCWINQQVTIGYSNATDCPILGDNVSVKAGAKIIGNVFIGNNSKVGANAVVVKNVPENCTVVGVPAYIVRRNGIKQRKEL